MTIYMLSTLYLTVSTHYLVTIYILSTQYLTVSTHSLVRWEAVVRVQDEARVSELQFTGPVFAVDTTGDMVMETGACLAMSDKQVSTSIYSVKHRLQV